MEEREIITGNVFDKYGSKNPIYKKLMSRFLSNLLDNILTNYKEQVYIFEIGCGEGYLANEIQSRSSAYSWNQRHSCGSPHVFVAMFLRWLDFE